MIEDAVYDILSHDTAIIALASNRIYPLSAPESVSRPYLVYRMVSEVRDTPINGPSGFVMCRCQIDCVASDYDTARRLSEFVRSALHGFQGDAGGHNIQRALLDNRLDGYEFEMDGSENPIVIVTCDYRIVYGESY